MRYSQLHSANDPKRLIHIHPNHISNDPRTSIQLHQQTTSITINHTPTTIPILHNIQISLRHILRPANFPCRTPLLDPLHKPLQPNFRHAIPQRRHRSPRTYQIDPNRRQIERQIPRHAVQTRSIGSDHRPVFMRSLANAARGQGDGRSRAWVEMLFRMFGYQYRSEESNHTRLLYLL